MRAREITFLGSTGGRATRRLTRSPSSDRTFLLLVAMGIASVGCDGEPSVESGTSALVRGESEARDVDAAAPDAAGLEADSPPTEERPFRESAPDLEALVATYDVRPEVLEAARASGEEARLHERLAYRWTRDEESVPAPLSCAKRTPPEAEPAPRYPAGC